VGQRRCCGAGDGTVRSWQRAATAARVAADASAFCLLLALLYHLFFGWDCRSNILLPFGGRGCLRSSSCLRAPTCYPTASPPYSLPSYLPTTILLPLPTIPLFHAFLLLCTSVFMANMGKQHNGETCCTAVTVSGIPAAVWLNALFAPFLLRLLRTCCSFFAVAAVTLPVEQTTYLVFVSCHPISMRWTLRRLTFRNNGFGVNGGRAGGRGAPGRCSR